MGFADDECEVVTKSDQYVKPSKLPAGEHRFRILGSPLVGCEAWKTVDGKQHPVRKELEAPWSVDEVDNPNRIVRFWSFPVWNYARGMLQVMSITQQSIMAPLRKLAKSAKWGEPTEYDIVISRSGTGMETEYGVMPEPKAALDPAIGKRWAECLAAGFDLRRLFDGGDPFGKAPVIPADDGAEEVDFDAAGPDGASF